MIPARHQPWADRIFEPYLRRLLKKHFNSIQLFDAVGEWSASTSLLVLPNHSSWWDGFFFYILNKQIWHREMYLMMLEDQLARNAFFSRLGAFSIQQKSAAAVRASLRYSLKVLRQKNRPVLCLFPQGKLVPWGKRPLGYQPGIRYLLQHVGGPVQLVQLAIKIEFGQEQRPDAYLMLKGVQETKQNMGNKWEGLEGCHEDLLESLAEKISRQEMGKLLLKGENSINNQFEAIRSLIKKR